VALGVLQAQGQFLAYKGKRLGRFYENNKERFLDQDKLAEDLLAQHPKLLTELDEKLDKGLLAPAAPPKAEAAQEEEEE
jgi:hypothetical protein